MRKNEMITKAMEILEDGEIFANCCEELDSWNGFLDGERLESMDNLDDFYYGATVSKFLQDLTKDFSYYDDYFYFTIYGLESYTGDRDAFYKEIACIDGGELLDNLIANYNHLDLSWIDSELDEVISALFNEEYEN